MNTFQSSGRPWHLWLVGIVSLLWNSLSVVDFGMTLSGSAEYLRLITEGSGVSPQAAAQYFAAFPLWMDIAWAAGVGGSILGAVLLLGRSGFAYYAFLLSAIGLAITLGYQTINPLSGLTDSAAALTITAVVLAFGLFEIWYCRRLALRGVLR